jgi:hypothetical protein
LSSSALRAEAFTGTLFSSSSLLSLSTTRTLAFPTLAKLSQPDRSLAHATCRNTAWLPPTPTTER